MAGSLLGGDLIGSKQGTIQTQSSNEPWASVQPHLGNVFAHAQNLYSNYGPYNYQNVSPFTRQAERLTAERALDPNALIPQAQGALGDTISGKYLTPDSNPYLRASVQDALGMAGSAFAGQFGGPAGQNLGNSGYQEALARGLGATATNAYANAYGNERQNQLNAMQLAPSLDYANLGALANVGKQQDMRSLMQYGSPWENLSRYQAALSPGIQNFGQGTQQTPYYQNNTAQTLGLLGTAAMFMSDRRLKSNIVKVGEHPKGFGIYRYEIFGKTEVGVMAQEVMDVLPEAVVEMPNGYLAVRYDLIGGRPNVD